MPQNKKEDNILKNSTEQIKVIVECKQSRWPQINRNTNHIMVLSAKNLNTTDLSIKLGRGGKGVCLGFSMEYARHVLNNKYKNRHKSFLNKLNKSDDELSNFLTRVKSYQTHLQEMPARGNCFYTITNREGLTYKLNSQLFTFDLIPSNYKNAQIIGISIYSSIRNQATGHIFAVQLIRNNNNKVIRYEIYDSNYGIINCQDWRADENRMFCEKQINNILKKYQADIVSVYDLGAIVEEIGLVTKDIANYRKEQKYKWHKTLDLTTINDKQAIISKSFACLTISIIAINIARRILYNQDTGFGCIEDLFILIGFCVSINTLIPAKNIISSCDNVPESIKKAEIEQRNPNTKMDMDTNNNIISSLSSESAITSNSYIRSI